MEQGPIISVLHPTARVKPYPPSFPRGCWSAVEQLANAAVKPHLIEYVLIVHASRWSEFWENFGGDAPDTDRVILTSPSIDLWGSFLVIKNSGRDCVVDQINCGAAASTGQLLVGVMDDLEAPARWDEKLTRCLPRGTHCGKEGLDFDGEYVIDLTGEPSDWIVYSALTRKRFERYGYILHPDFESMYSDNYFSAIAHRDGVVINGRHLGFKHCHPSNDPNQQMDEVYRSQNEPLKYFKGRQALMRLLGQPVQEVIAMCLPGEWFQAEWVSMFTNLFGYISGTLGMMANPYFAHTSNVYCTRMDLVKGVLESPVESDYVLWIDDDNKLSCDQFDRLLKDLKEHPELDGVCGWCWCDNHQSESHEFNTWTMSCGKQGPNLECHRFTPEELRGLGPLITSREIEAEPGMGFWSGFPVVLMRRSVLVTLGAGVFAPVFREDVNFGFTGEDTAFFWRARQAGLNFAVDLRVKVPHMKWRAIEMEVMAPEKAAQPELVNTM